MFTGIITDVGSLARVEDQGAELRRMRIHCGYDPATIAIGASIACSGPCLTVVALGYHENGAWIEVDAAAETLQRTTVPSWTIGTRVNLERSLRIGDELGGHLVSGHVDAVATIVERAEVTGDGPWGATARFMIRVPEALKRFIAPKGSVALDGMSLTVNDVADDAFSVLLIPHTLAHTTWGEARAGDAVNLEIDQMARYAARRADVDASG